MNSQSSHAWPWLLIALLIGAALWALAPVLMPFAIAAGLAYLSDPLADRLQRLRLNRTLAVSIVFVLIALTLAGVLLLLVPLLQRQIENLLANLPRYLEWLRATVLPWLEAHLRLEHSFFDGEHILATLKKHIGSFSSIAATTLAEISRSGLSVAVWLSNLVLVPVVTFYLLRDWDMMVERVHRLVPRSVEPTVARLAREVDQVLGAFVRGQLTVMLALGAIYGTGLSLIGLSVGLLIGIIAGLLSFVPYLGFIIGLTASLIAALVQYGDWLHVILVLAVFAIGQAMEGYVLLPRLVGGKIGLHPVAVIFAVLAGGHLFGFLGVLLALPAAAAIMVLLRYAHQRYQASDLYDSPDRIDAQEQTAAASKAVPGRGPLP